MQRITIAMLESRIDLINELTNSPATPYTKNLDDNGYDANVGNYHLSQAYGGVCLVRMTDGGGESCPLSGGHVPKRDLYNELNAFIAGLQA